MRLRWARLLAASYGPETAFFKLRQPDGAWWLEALLRHECKLPPRTWAGNIEYRESTLASHVLEEMLEASGMPRHALLTLFFTSPTGPYADLAHAFVLELPDYREALDRHLDAVRPHLAPDDAFQQRHVLKLLSAGETATLERIAAEIAALATAADAPARDAARILARRIGAAAVAPLRALAAEADPARRRHALASLGDIATQLGDAALRAWTHATAAADTVAEVRALVPRWRIDAEGGAGGLDDAASAPRVDDDAFDAFVASLRAAIADFNANRLHTTFGSRPLAPFDDADAQRLRAFLDGPALTTFVRRRDHAWIGDVLRAAIAGPQARFAPQALLKLFAFFGKALQHDGQPHPSLMQAFAAQYAATGHPTPLEIGRLMDRLGAARGNLLLRFCDETGEALGTKWPADTVHPYIAHHVDVLAGLLRSPPEALIGEALRNVYRAVERLPAVAPELVDPLFDRALGNGRVQRPLAQHALARLPGKETRIAAALADARPSARAAAAAWLAKLGDAHAVAPLEAALAGEKAELAKEAIFDALQSLGQPVEKYIDLAALAAQARKGLAKGTPPALAWFPWSALPAVRWADGGPPVPADTLRWLLVQAAKQKSAEPTVVQRKLGAMFAPDDRAALGRFVLDAWLHEDLHPAPTAASDAAPLPSLATARAGAAIDAKGLLAIAGACIDATAAPAVLRYVAGPGAKRAAQCRALVAMLAWVDHPSATTALMVLANKARVPAVRREALAQAGALAERRGWTFFELGDRTIPALGFDAAGVLALDYGPRAFTARLEPGLQIALRDAGGKKIAALPAARADDDPAAVAAAKEALAEARKSMRLLVVAETERLRDAWRAQREWPAADWRAWLLAHPVMRQLLQRLVWTEIGADGQAARHFRPLADGTLTDLDDADVVLAEDAHIRIAGPASTSAEDRVAWERHLVDYEIAPLFAQFGPGTT